MSTPLKLAAGRNLAMKVPPHLYEATIAFYRDVIGLRQVSELAPSVVFEFGTLQLWIDRAPQLSQTETWLEIVTNDAAAAAAHFRETGVVRCDDIEPLPDGFAGFWISSPASVVHLVCETPELLS